MRKKSRLFSTLLLMCITLASCPPNLEIYRRYGDYCIRVRIYAETGSSNAAACSSHFRQSLVVNTSVSLHSIPVHSDDLEGTDLVYFCDDYPFDSSKMNQTCSRLETFASKGGLVCFESNCLLDDGQLKINEHLANTIGFESIERIDPVFIQPKTCHVQPILSRLEEFFRKSIENPLDHERSYYEKKHLPDFVETIPENSRWESFFKTRALSCDLICGSGSQPLAVYKSIGRGGIIWTADFSGRNRLFFDQTCIRDFKLGYPDPMVSNFLYGKASLDYIFRYLLTDLASRLKFGFTLEWVYGPNGSPACSWQNHLDGFEVWDTSIPTRWTDILRSVHQIPSFTIRNTLLDFSQKNRLSGDDALAAEQVRYCSRAGVPFNLHLEISPKDSASIESERIARHFKRMAAIGIPSDSITGVDHHVFYTHPQPVWQSFYSVKNAGLLHDFGGSTLSNYTLFPYFFCTSLAYRPYCFPFLLENRDDELEPFVIWSPLPAVPSFNIDHPDTFSDFPASFRLPITSYFHPEFIYDSKTIEELHPQFRALIMEHSDLRDLKGYSPVTESQVAKTIIASRFSKLPIHLLDESIEFELDSSGIPASVAPFDSGLGIRFVPSDPTFFIESEFPTDAKCWRTDPHDRSIELALWENNKTHLFFKKRLHGLIHIERVNVPFTLEKRPENIVMSIREPGLRWIRLALEEDASAGWLPVDFDPFVLSMKNHGLELVHYGDSSIDIRFLKFEADKYRWQLKKLIAEAEPVQETFSEINFGTPAVRRLLGKGWCIHDETGIGGHFTWSSGRLFSELSVPVYELKDLDCDLRVRPFKSDPSDPQQISLYVNGHFVFSRDLIPGWQMLHFSIPAAALLKGTNAFKFLFKHMDAPGLHDPDSEDLRLLAVCFDFLNLKPVSNIGGTEK